MSNRRKTFIVIAIWLAASLPAPLYADHAININTADKAALVTLTGIGEVKAQAIIDYRTQNGPFAKIEDIMNVSGIGTATFDNIKNHITVSGSAAPSAASQPSTTTIVSAAGNSPPPMSLQIVVEDVSIVGAGSLFEASAYNQKGEPLTSGVRYVWTFGDGVAAEGKRVFHSYAYPGVYALQVSAGYGYSSAVSRERVEVIMGDLSIQTQKDGSLLFANRSSKDINIGLWSLVQGGKTFVVPKDTYVLAGLGVQFAPDTIGFAATTDTAVYYPNGAPALAVKLGADSALRGEVVSLATPVRATPRSQPEADKEEPEEPVEMATAVARADGASLPLWGSLAGLGVLLALGVAGSWYARARPETPTPEDEFSIE